MNIIFLDIDGPVIDITCSFIESEFRLTHNPNSIKMLEHLCNTTQAKIVTNSMHNFNNAGGRSLKEDLISWGLSEDHFHENWRTIFPAIDYTKVNSPVRGIGRLIAIETWIDQNGPVNWVCFDDRKFTDLSRLVFIEDGLGIRDKHVELAKEILLP